MPSRRVPHRDRKPHQHPAPLPRHNRLRGLGIGDPHNQYALTDGRRGGVPVGGIIMFSGNEAGLPDNWAVCNGQTVEGVTTPDLRDRFVVASGGVYEQGDQGGSDTHGHSQSDTGADGGHGHTSAGAHTGHGSHTHGQSSTGGGNLSLDSAGSHGHSVGSTGSAGGHSHNIGDGSDVTVSRGSGTLTTPGLTHQHGGSTGGVGGHSHSNPSTGSGGSHSHSGTSHQHSNPDTGSAGSSTSAGGHTHNTISDHTHGNPDVSTEDNRPLYYALAFIMRVK